MSVVARHPKVSVRVVLQSAVFEAGAPVAGQLELSCATGTRLRLGEIAVELEGREGECKRGAHAETGEDS
jgi:hypothetical protein